MMDRFRAFHLLDEKWTDTELRITHCKSLVARLIEPHHPVTSNQNMLPLVLQDPACPVGLIHGLLSLERRFAGTHSPPILDFLRHHLAPDRDIRLRGSLKHHDTRPRNRPPET